MKNTVVLFKPRTYPKGSRNDRMTPVHLPLGLLTVASPLVRDGYRVVVYDENFEEDIKTKLQVLKDDIIAIGITAQTGYEIVGGVRMSKYAKETLKVPTIWGGWHPSTVPRQTAENIYVDFVVKGAGQQTLLDLIKAINNDLSFKDIESILYKKNGNIFENRTRRLMDINNYPLPSYDLVDVEKYIQDGCNKGTGISNDVHFKKERMLMYVTSYGCVHRCRYCAATSVFNRQITLLKAETVGEQLESLVKKYNIQTIFFIDSNFFASAERVKKICNEILKRRLNIKYVADPRVDHIMRWDGSVLPLLKKSGCVWLGVGSESGSQNILDYMQKDIKASDIMKAARKVLAAGIDVTFFFMFAMPMNESKKDLFESLKLAAQLKELYPKILLPMYFYDPFPSTPMYYDAVKSGFREPNSLEEWGHRIPDVIDKNPLTPYVSDRYVDMVKRVIIFYLPLTYPADMVLGTLTHIKTQMKKGRYKYLLRFLHVLARIRTRHQFYYIPVEWMVFKFVQKLMPHRIYKK